MKSKPNIVFRIDGNPIKVEKYLFIGKHNEMTQQFKYGLMIFKDSVNILLLFTSKDSLLDHYDEFYESHTPVWTQEFKKPIIV